MKLRLTSLLAGVGSLVLAGAPAALAADPPTLESVAKSVADNGVALDTVWVLLAAYLVFFMQPGFAMVEAGFTRAKNAVNILAKNFVDFAVASILYFLVGYAFMFGEGNSFIGLTGFGLSGLTSDGLPVWASWIFQAVFCGTAATIVSGGMAERTKFGSYLVATAVLTAFIYPIIGHWTWGGGWLSQMGFFDFAGSTIVHGTGGWVAWWVRPCIGARIGKYGPDGKPKVLAGHSMPLAALGVFILWFGWFGFNPGSQLAASGLDNANAIALITINTNLAAAAGALGAMFLVWAMFGKPDVSMMMNGALAGLVAITAPCAVVSPGASIIIGVIAGCLVVAGVTFFDRIGGRRPGGRHQRARRQRHVGHHRGGHLGPEGPGPGQRRPAARRRLHPAGHPDPGDRGLRSLRRGLHAGGLRHRQEHGGPARGQGRGAQGPGHLRTRHGSL